MRYRFQFRQYRLPLRTTVRTAQRVWTEREGVIVRLEIPETEDRKPERGHGYGEAAPIPEFGTETIDEIVAVCRELGEWIDDDRLATVPAELRCLRNAIASAQNEVGRVFSSPSKAKKNLGAGGADESEKGRIEAASHYLSVAALLPAGKAALALIEPKAEIGFRVFKWKVGVGDVADELSLLDDVCARLPSGAKLRLDANGAWDRRKAERWLERCAERPIEFLEQPVAAEMKGAPDVLLGLAGDYPTPLALDESLMSDADVERWLGAGWPGVFVVKPSLLGDVEGAIARLEKARADVVFSSAFETAVGARAALRVAFAFATARQATAKEAKARALGFGVWPFFADSRFDGPVAAPFLRAEDVERIDAEAVWNALS